MSERHYHDIGGEPAGPVVRDERPLQHWEWETEAIRGILEKKSRLVSLDEIRRCFETFGYDKYGRGFYERRTEALAMLLVEKGVLTRAEIEARMEAIRARLGAPE